MKDLNLEILREAVHELGNVLVPIDMNFFPRGKKEPKCDREVLRQAMKRLWQVQNNLQNLVERIESKD